MAIYNKKIGEMTPDNLIADIHVKQVVVSGTIAAGAGVLKRGTVLGMAADAEKLSVYDGSEGVTPYGILCDETDATEDAVAEVYLTGKFNKGALVVADGYELTASDIQILRNGGIFVENVVE